MCPYVLVHYYTCNWAYSYLYNLCKYFMRIIEKQTNKWDQFAQLIPLLKRTGRLQDAETIIGDMDERDCPGRRYCRALIDFSKLETEAAMNNLIISKRSKKWKNLTNMIRCSHAV